MNELVDRIFETCKNHKNLLNNENAPVIKTMISKIVRQGMSGNKKAVPTKEEIMRIFFGNIDFSRFSDVDLEDSISGIMSIITIWEQNKIG